MYLFIISIYVYYKPFYFWNILTMEYFWQENVKKKILARWVERLTESFNEAVRPFLKTFKVDMI